MNTVLYKKMVSYLALTSLFLVNSVVAAPPGSQYIPGETADPSCAQGDPNCDVDLSSIDDQILTLSGSELIISDGNSVDLSSLGGGTFTLSGSTDTDLTGSATGSVLYFDGTQWIDLDLGAQDQVLTSSGGNLVWKVASSADDLGDHTATQTLDMAGFNINDTGDTTILGTDTPSALCDENGVLSQCDLTVGSSSDFGTAVFARQRLSLGPITGGGIGFENVGTNQDSMLRITNNGNFWIGGGTANSGRGNSWAQFTNAGNLGLGTGNTGPATRLDVAGDIRIRSQGDLRLADGDSSNYAAIEAPADITSNYTLTLPSDDGDANEVLTTDGSGVLSWASAGAGSSTLSGATDTDVASAATGSTIYFDGTNWVDLDVGTPGQKLVAGTGGTLSWVTDSTTSVGLVYYSATNDGSGAMFTTTGLAQGSLENIDDASGIANTPGGTTNFTLPNTGKYRVSFAGYLNSTNKVYSIQLDQGSGYTTIYTGNLSNARTNTVSHDFDANAGDDFRVITDATATITSSYFRIEQLPTTAGVGVGGGSGTGATTLDGLTDTNFTSQGTGSILYYDGSEWIDLDAGTPGQKLVAGTGGTLSWETDSTTNVVLSSGSTTTLNTSSTSSTTPVNIASLTLPNDGKYILEFQTGWRTSSVGNGHLFQIADNTGTEIDNSLINSNGFINGNRDTLYVTAEYDAVAGEVVHFQSNTSAGATITFDNSRFSYRQVPTTAGVGIGGSGTGATTLDELTDTNLTSQGTGSILYYDGSEWIDLDLGTSGQVLTSSGGTLEWQSGSPTEDSEVVLIDVDAVDNTFYAFSTGESWADIRANYSHLRIVGNASQLSTNSIRPYSFDLDPTVHDLPDGQSGARIDIDDGHNSVNVYVDFPADTDTGFTYRHDNGDAPTSGRMQFKVIGVKAQKTVINSNDVPTNITSAGTGSLLYYDGSEWIDLDLGTNGQILTSSGGTLEWQSGSTTEDVADVLFAQSAAHGVNANLYNSVTWQDVVDDYETVQVFFRFGTTNSNNHSFIMRPAAFTSGTNRYQMEVSAGVTLAIDGIDMADGQFLPLTNGTTYDITIVGIKKQKTVINANDFTGTAGSVVFSDGSSVVEDNANLFWDDTNDRLGIGNSNPAIDLAIGDNDTGLEQVGDGQLGIMSNNIEVVRFESGTTILRPQTTGGEGGEIQFDGSAGQGTYVIDNFNDISAQDFRVLEGGSVRAFVTNGLAGWQTPSDKRLKDNIETLSVLENISSVRGASYDLKDSGAAQIGVIAQEVQAVFPEAVVGDEDTGMLGVSYQAIAAIALQGVKEIYAMFVDFFDTTNERMAELEAENEALKSRLDAIEAQLQ